MKTSSTSVHKRLVVAVTGLPGRLAPWEAFRDLLEHHPGYENDHWLLHAPKPSILNTHGLRHFARNLSAVIQDRITDAIDEIVLIGHSTGGLLVRSAYLLAVSPEYLGNNTCAWASRVKRIVLFATPNRGRRRPAVAFLLGTLGEWACPILRDLLHGSDFLTDLKVGWILHFQRLHATGGHAPPVIWLVLGTKDGRVRREDNLDIEQLPNGGSHRLPDADHNRVHRWDWLPAEQQGRRQDLLIDLCFAWRPAPKVPQSNALKKIAQKKKRVKQVVFVLPGIRDANPEWTEQLKKVLSNPYTAVKVANYGYFSAAQFLLSGVRRRSIGWFQDAYTGALLDYPNAQDFHFVGHSNGTYILGRSLERLSGMHFKHVYLAGSVLPENYNWNKRVEEGQVQNVRNDKSAGDWPVGVLCRVMNKVLRMKDVGVGGFAGFSDFNNHAQCWEYHYCEGDHGAPIQPGNHASIKAFIQHGTGGPSIPMTNQGTAFVKRWNKHGPAATLVALLLVAALLLFAVLRVLEGDPAGWLLGGSVLAILGGAFYILHTL